MDISKGGRGKKAPYKTTHVRVPEPIKAEVERMAAQYRAGELNTMPALDDAIQTAQSILRQKKSARASMEKLLTSLYGQTVSL